MNRIASMASIPERADIVVMAANSIASQVDEVHVSLNNYENIPTGFSDNVKPFLNKNDKGDGEKFLRASYLSNTTIYICDDDLYYSANYADLLENCLDKYNKEVAVTLHGRVMKELPIANYFSGHKQIVRCLGASKYDLEVDVGGTGVLCYNSDHIKFSYSDIHSENMGDIWFSLYCAENNIPIIASAHNKGLVCNLLNANGRKTGSTLFHRYARKKEIGRQTEVVNWLLEVKRSRKNKI